MPIVAERRTNREREDSGIQHSASAIGAFIALTGLTIVIITQLKIYDFNTITILLILMLLVLIYGFWGKSIRLNIKNYQEERDQNKSAIFYFEGFKKLVLQFEEFTGDREDNIPHVMQELKNGSGIPEFSQIKVLDLLIIQNSYRYYKEHLATFNKTKVSLKALAEQFESILTMYDKVYVEEPAKTIKTTMQEKLPEKYKEKYNNSRQKYIAFRDDYRKFAKVANEDFKDKELTDTYGVTRIFKDYFDYPVEL